MFIMCRLNACVCLIYVWCMLNNYVWHMLDVHTYGVCIVTLYIYISWHCRYYLRTILSEKLYVLPVHKIWLP